MDRKNNSLSAYEKEVKLIQKQISDKEMYNVKTFVKRSLVKSGIALDYALPFIIASFIIAGKFVHDGNPPFLFDNITEKANVEITDTSEGFHIEKISYDFTYSDTIFEYSTGWNIDEDGLYERMVTSYVTEDVDLNDTNKIFSMTSEEAAEKFVIDDVRVIKKNTLTEEDKIYAADCFTIVKYMPSDEDSITRKESSAENAWHSLVFLFFSALGGLGISRIEKVVLKGYIRDKLKNYKAKLVYLDTEEVEELKDMIIIREDNLSLFDNNAKPKSYQLRKK